MDPTALSRHESWQRRNTERANRRAEEDRKLNDAAKKETAILERGGALEESKLEDRVDAKRRAVFVKSANNTDTLRARHANELEVLKEQQSREIKAVILKTQDKFRVL